MNQFPSQGQTGSASNVPANPLGTLPINQLLARFAIPSIIAMLVSALYNIVDQFRASSSKDQEWKTKGSNACVYKRVI